MVQRPVALPSLPGSPHKKAKLRGPRSFFKEQRQMKRRESSQGKPRSLLARRRRSSVAAQLPQCVLKLWGGMCGTN